jgi:hypothetical protein
MYYKIDNVDKFFEINMLIVKYFLKTPECIHNSANKFDLEIFNDKLSIESSEKFVSWLLQ